MITVPVPYIGAKILAPNQIKFLFCVAHSCWTKAGPKLFGCTVQCSGLKGWEAQLQLCSCCFFFPEADILGVRVSEKDEEFHFQRVASLLQSHMQVHEKAEKTAALHEPNRPRTRGRSTTSQPGPYTYKKMMHHLGNADQLGVSVGFLDTPLFGRAREGLRESCTCPYPQRPGATPPHRPGLPQPRRYLVIT